MGVVRATGSLIGAERPCRREDLINMLEEMTMYIDKKSKAAAIISYLFAWIGIVVALLLRNKGDELSRHHVNQALVLAIAESIATLLIKTYCILSLVGIAACVGVLILSIMGIVRAAKGSAEPLPIIGNIKLY